MKVSKTAHRSRLTDSNFSPTMKSAFSKTFTPNIAKLIANKECQISGKMYKILQLFTYYYFTKIKLYVVIKQISQVKCKQTLSGVQLCSSV